MSRQRLFTGALAIAFVFAIAHLIPNSRPIYDGVCVPDPYKYFNPPAGITNPGPPNPATKTDTGDQLDTIHYISTDEQPPQAQFEMGSGVLNLPKTTTQITLGLHAVPAPSIPADGPIQGNVYSATVTADNGGQIEPLPGKSFDVELTAPKSKSTIVIEQFVGGKWQRLSTESNLECSGDGYAAGPTQFGLFALVDPTPGSNNGGSGNGSSSGSDSGAGLPLPVLLAAILLVIVGFVLKNLVRRNA